MKEVRACLMRKQKVQRALLFRANRVIFGHFASHPAIPISSIILIKIRACFDLKQNADSFIFRRLESHDGASGLGKRRG